MAFPIATIYTHENKMPHRTVKWFNITKGMEKSILLRKAQPDEAPVLSKICFNSKASWGYSNSFMNACREELTLTPSYIQTNPTFVIQHGDDLAGFYTLEHISSEEVELGYLFVTPAMIGNGYGRSLMIDAVKRSKSKGYKSILV
jgi:hypothetical protein